MQASAKIESTRRLTPGLCLALAAITFAVFGRTLRHQFVNYDDDLYVYANPSVARGLTWHGFAWAFTQVHSVNWHPVTWLSHMLDCQIYGLDPRGHHLTNVLLHAAAVVTLFLALREMTGAIWRSAFVAALFAIHPLRVESVAWVAERKDVLSGLFFVLTIWSYARHYEQGRKSLPALSLIFFALGLMSKPMLVTVPVVLLLLDRWPLQRKEPLKQLLFEKIPFFALSAMVCVITIFAQRQAIHSGGSFSATARFANALVACAVYLRQMIWPAGLAVLYPFPLHGTPALEVVVAVMLLAAISVAAWRMRLTRPWIWIGWLWYLVMLLPVLGLIQVGRQAHADRYTYLPGIGIAIGVVWLVAEWRIHRAAFAGVIAVLMFCAWKQTAVWQDSITLWTSALARTTDNDMAHNNLGFALDKDGRIDDAIDEFREALKINPNNIEARNNLASRLLEKGNVKQAIALAQRVVQESPNFPEGHFNLAKALRQAKRTDEALAQYEEFVQLEPSSAEGQNSLGMLLRQKGRVDEAIAHYQKALEILPDNESIHVNLANAFQQAANVPEAIAHYQRALEIVPDDMEVQNNLAWLLATSAQDSLRNAAKAVELAQQANKLSGGINPVVLGTLAAALAEAGQFDHAQRTARQAIALARNSGHADLARRIADELKFYEANKPYHRP